MTAVSEFTRVYAAHGKMAHLLPVDESPNIGYPFTLCRRQPRLFTTWLGTGSQAEYEHAAALPVCERCARTASASLNPENFPVRDIPPVPGRELNAAAPVLAAATPGKATPARENAATASPRGDRGTASVPAAPPAGAEALKPVSGTGHPPVPLTAGSAPDGRASVPGADRGQVEPSSRVPVSPAATAAAALGGSRGTQKPASGPSPGQPDVAGGQAGHSPAAARAAAARATSGGSGSAGPERGPGPASASSSADQGPAEEEQGPAGGGRPRVPLAGETPGVATGRSSAAAPGPERLRGQEGRDAVRAAESKLAAAKRAGRGRYPVKRAGDGYKPGMTRRMPPGSAS